MQSRRDIKRRIRSVENIAQITKAMEVVSMTKMRRSQAFALAARPYALAALRMLKNVLKMTPAKDLPLILKERPYTDRALVVITADKGLVGGFNDVVLRKAEEWIKMEDQAHIPYTLITVGKKAKEHFERMGVPITQSFTSFGDISAYKDTAPVADLILNGFENDTWDAVDIIYTHFKTTLKQETMMRQLLPTTQASLEELIKEIIPEYGRFSELKNEEGFGVHEAHYNYSYIFEPSPEKILNELVPNLLRIALHHVMLESNASEHSARMVTMKNASDNATELEEKLTLEFNKARQASITAELSEIIAGAEALQ